MSCLVFDATSRCETDLMKVLFGNQEVTTIGESSFVWHVKNKYYSARVVVDVVKSLESERAPEWDGPTPSSISAGTFKPPQRPLTTGTAP